MINTHNIFKKSANQDLLNSEPKIQGLLHNITDIPKNNIFQATKKILNIIK